MFSSEAISADDLFYYRQRYKNRVFSAVVSLFSKLVETKGMTKRELAFRLNKEPAQITRWFSGPSNWTLDTVSDLLLAMGSELDHSVAPIDQIAIPRGEHPLVRQDAQRPVIVFLRPEYAFPSLTATDAAAPVEATLEKIA